MATIRDVAERADVSLGTVSRVLNGHPAVRPAMREKVEAAIRDLGYVPNPAAQSLRSSRTRTIGLIVPDLMSPMTVQLVRHVEDEVRAIGFTPMVAESRFDAQLEATHIANMLDRRIDGLLISPIESVSAVVRAVAPSRTPTVLLQLRQPRRELPSVYVEEGPAMRDAVDAIVARGHRRVALVHSASRVAGGRHRREILRTALREHGIESGEWLDAVFSSSAECRQRVMELLARPDRPTTLIVGVHQFVPSALAAIRDSGLRLGAEVSLVVFGDSEWARAMTPALSVIVVDQAVQAAGAVSLLARALRRERSGPHSMGSESVFILRESLQPVCQEARRD